MEEWQREHMRKNLPGLAEVTKFRQSLLDKLMAEGVIGPIDIGDLTREGLPEYRRISELYDMLQTRDNGFNVLSSVLLADNQTGAYRILQQGLVHHSGILPSKFATTPFFSTVLPHIERFLDDELIRILIVVTPDLQLSLKRITDVGLNYLILHDDRETRLSKKKLLSMDEEAVHVIPCDNVGSMLKRLEGSTANVVLMTKESWEEVATATARQTQNIRIIGEDIAWGALSQHGQEMILQQCVKFQNQVIPLNKIPREIFPTEELRGEIIFDLLNEMCPELVKNSIPLSPNYYIPRKIINRVNLSPEIFQNAGEGDDVFVVEGLELYQLTNLKMKLTGEVFPVARSSQQLQKLTAQFIQLEHAKDYQDICELSKNEKPVHLISHRNGEYLWRRSHKSLGIIQKYIREKKEDVQDEDSFLKSYLASERPACIADSPGMGKTLLLARIAEKVMSESASDQTVVRFLVLRDLIPELQNQTEMNIEFACELIAKSSSDYDLGKQIVINALKEEKIRCHVFLDGYDELLSNQISIVNQLLGCLRKLENTKLYVTTRRNRCHELEEALVTLGHHIEPFDEEDQVDFLTGYWSEAGADKNDRLDQFAKSCLKRLKSGMTETERDIVGIPLQCRLIAEVHDKNATQYSEGRDVILEEASASSLFKMFQLFINMSFGKLEASMKERVRVQHTYYAIKLLFPEIQQEFKQVFLEEDWVAEESILFAPGILEKAETDRLPTFIHQTMAEYLVANFVCEFLETSESSERVPVVSAVLCQVLATTQRDDILLKNEKYTITSQAFQHPVICYFLNSFMGTGSNTTEITRKTVMELVTHVSFPKSPNGLTAAVASNFPVIAFFLSNSGQFDFEMLPWSNLFLLAAKYAEPHFMVQLKTLVEQKRVDIAEIKNYPVVKTRNLESFVLTPLHLAVHWGNYNVATLLLNSVAFHDIFFEEANKQIRYLLHLCVMRSCEDTEQVINDKIQLIKWLCAEEQTKEQPIPYRDFLEERLHDRKTPLLRYRVHAELIKCLIQVGADTNACNTDNQCVLHRVILYGNSFSLTQFHELLVSLTKTNFQHYNLQNTDTHTPLHYAIRAMDIEMKTVDLFLKKGADVNHTDKDGKSILFHALERGRSKEFVCEFAGLGANFVCGMNGRTSSISAKVMEAVEYIIETTPSLLNTYSCKMLETATDEDGKLGCIINAKVDLQEMESQQLSTYVLTLDNCFVSKDTPAELSFVVHSFGSDFRYQRVHVRHTDSWGLAFNYNKIQQNCVIEDVRGNKAKVVLLNQELIDKIEKVFQQTGKYPIVAVEAIQLKELPKTAQQLICSQKVSVQGVPETISYPPNSNFPIHGIKGKFLFDCTIQHHTSLLNWDNLNSIPKHESNFNIRKIKRRQNVSTSIFQTPENDVFVTGGLDSHTLSEFTQGTSTDESNQTSELTARCIQLESEDDFGKICNLSTFPGHMFSYREGNFIWMKSHASIACIQQNIHEQQQQASLAAFLKECASPNTPICIVVDDKRKDVWQEVVAELGKQTCQNSTSISFCLYLDHRFIEKVKASLTPATATQFIAEMLSDYKLGREYVISCLQSHEITCHLILVCLPHYPFPQDQLSTLAKAVCHMKELKTLQLHIIIPHTILLDMEKALGTLGSNFVL